MELAPGELIPAHCRKTLSHYPRRSIAANNGHRKAQNSFPRPLADGVLAGSRSDPGYRRRVSVSGVRGNERTRRRSPFSPEGLGCKETIRPGKAGRNKNRDSVAGGRTEAKTRGVRSKKRTNGGRGEVQRCSRTEPSLRKGV